MDNSLLETNAKSLVRAGHGILASDDSLRSSTTRFEDVGLEHTEETRRQYRQTLFTSPKGPEVLSGVILYEETFRQRTDSGLSIPEYLTSRGILPGIKLDQGLQELPGFPGEKITAGLDSLPERIKEFAVAGAKFAKWRNVIAIGDGMPTDECIGANTYILARYARICQENGIVPIIEPEVLMDGTHTAAECERVTAHVYDLMFLTLRSFRAYLPGCIMKSAMVMPGKQSTEQMQANDVAERTVRVLADHVPTELGGVVFLSGGQSTEQAFVNLNRIEQKAIGKLPFGLTFSYLRALQDPALAYWAKNRGDVAGTHAVLDMLLEKAAAASNGTLDESSIGHVDGGEAKKGYWEY